MSQEELVGVGHGGHFWWKGLKQLHWCPGNVALYVAASQTTLYGEIVFLCWAQSCKLCYVTVVHTTHNVATSSPLYLSLHCPQYRRTSLVSTFGGTRRYWTSSKGAYIGRQLVNVTPDWGAIGRLAWSMSRPMRAHLRQLGNNWCNRVAHWMNPARQSLIRLGSIGWPIWWLNRLSLWLSLPHMSCYRFILSLIHVMLSLHMTCDKVAKYMYTDITGVLRPLILKRCYKYLGISRTYNCT